MIKLDKRKRANEAPFFSDNDKGKMISCFFCIFKSEANLNVHIVCPHARLSLSNFYLLLHIYVGMLQSSYLFKSEAFL